MIQLRVVGRNPVTISLDDYYKPHSLTPLDDEGRPDFESLDALDVALLNDTLVRLLRGEEVETPVFDFHAGARKPEGRRMRLPDRAVLILEGIHGLNDALTPLVPRESKHKVYVSALTQLNLDDHNRIATTDNRLIRRIVRDSQFRGHSAQQTLAMWPSVRRGENRNIFPFQNGADSAFNSALDYELAVLKVYADPLLSTVKPDVPEYQEARMLLSFLSNFAPLHPRWVPATSILREFIGESAFKYLRRHRTSSATIVPDIPAARRQPLHEQRVEKRHCDGTGRTSRSDSHRRCTGGSKHPGTRTAGESR